MNRPATYDEMLAALDAIRKVLDDCRDGEVPMNAALLRVVEIAEECNG